MDRPSFTRIPVGDNVFDEMFYTPYYAYKSDLKKFPGIIAADYLERKAYVYGFVDSKPIINILDFDIKNKLCVGHHPKYPYIFIGNDTEIMVYSGVYFKYLFSIFLGYNLKTISVDDKIIKTIDTNGFGRIYETFYEQTLNIKEIVPQTAFSFQVVERNQVDESAYISPQLESSKYTYENETFISRDMKEKFSHPHVIDFVYSDPYLISLVKIGDDAFFDIFKIKYVDQPTYQYVITKTRKFKPMKEPDVKSLAKLMPSRWMSQFMTLPDYSYRDPDEIEHLREKLRYE